MRRGAFLILVPLLAMTALVAVSEGAGIVWQGSVVDASGNPVPEGAVVQLLKAAGSIDDPLENIEFYKNMNFVIDDVILDETQVKSPSPPLEPYAFRRSSDVFAIAGDVLYVRAFNLSRAAWAGADISLRQVGIRNTSGHIVSFTITVDGIPLTFYCGTVQTSGALSAAASIEDVRISPYIPNEGDVLTIAAYGRCDGGGCDARAVAVVTGNTIEMFVQLTVGLSQYPWWGAYANVGPLPIGDYTVVVNLYVHGWLVDHSTESVSIAPVTSSGWTDKVALTSNQVSDSFPTALVYDDLLYVLWNKGYDGEVSCMTYDGATYRDRGAVADCETASGVGATVYRDSIFAFYSNGAYPTSHLFCRVFDGTDWGFEEQITAGDVYDAYGATATVYGGLLYLFWKRWETDGVRHVYYATFDGVSWGMPTHLVEDEYNDHPVTCVTFKDAVYLFYRHGSAYRVYHGSEWSTEMTTCEVPVLSGSEGASPAAVVSDEDLLLFLLSDSGHIYVTSFDGASWSAELRVTKNPDESILDMAAAMYHGRLYLVWGGGYWLSSNELWAMTLPPEMPLTVTRIVSEGSNKVRLVWGGAGLPMRYTVQSSTSLRLPDWSAVLPADQWPSAATTWTADVSHAGVSVFYRVVAE